LSVCETGAGVSCWCFISQWGYVIEKIQHDARYFCVREKESRDSLQVKTRKPKKAEEAACRN
jgi:hypothetical protein